MGTTNGTDAPAAALVDRYRPRTLAAIRGQDAIVRALRRYAAAPVPVGMVFEGATGTGKTSAAMALATELGVRVDQGPMGGFYQIASGEQTGEAVRDLAASLRLTPMLGSGWRVAVVNEADYMSDGAARIWLDVLETLGGRCLIIFTTNQPERLPVRFLDRCERYRFVGNGAALRGDLTKLLTEVWRAEGGPGHVPPLDAFRAIDDAGVGSFRRLLQNVAVALRTGEVPAIEAPAPRPATGEILDWGALIARHARGESFLDLARRTGQSWQRIMCGIRKRTRTVA